MSRFIDDSLDHSGSISPKYIPDITVLHRQRQGAFSYIAAMNTDR